MAIVTYNFKDLPKPKKEDLERIDAIKDEDINFSDIPEITEKDWERAMTYPQFLKYLREKQSKEY